MHLALADGEVDMVVGGHAGVAPGDAAALDRERRLRAHGALPALRAHHLFGHDQLPFGPAGELALPGLPAPAPGQAVGFSGTVISPLMIFCLIWSRVVGMSPSRSLLNSFWA